MRTIRFRGKRIDNKEWVYGYLYKLPLPSGEACMILTQDNNHLDDSLEPKYHLAFTLWVDLFLVDPTTVGQFTGLTDKNGKEIYEGDIIKTDSAFIGVVRWSAFGYFFIFCEGDEIDPLDYSTLGFMLRACAFEIIGNIHDNPELLGEE